MAASRTGDLRLGMAWRREVSVRVLVARTWILSAMFLVYALPAWSQVVLPEGKGRELMRRACVRCHGIEKLAGPDGGHWPAFGPGKSPEEWQRTMNFMMTYGTALSREEVTIVTDYLAKAFPGPARPAGVRIAGPVEASIREWKLPTSAHALTIRPSRPTAPSGIRGRPAAGWVVSIREQVSSGNIHFSQTTHGYLTASGRTGSSLTRMATSGIRGSSIHTSARSTPKRAP